MLSPSPYVLLSIREKWVKEIFAENKLYEYRRQPPTAATKYTVIFYAVRNTSESYIAGQATVDAVVSGSPGSVIDRTIADTPHTQPELEEYFEGADTGSALHLATTTEYLLPITKDALKTISNTFHPPQNFCYLSPEDRPQLFSMLPISRDSTQMELADF
jgi:predicted transcriptional regulator